MAFDTIVLTANIQPMSTGPYGPPYHPSIVVTGMLFDSTVNPGETGEFLPVPNTADVSMQSVNVRLFAADLLDSLPDPVEGNLAARSLADLLGEFRRVGFLEPEDPDPTNVVWLQGEPQTV